MATILVQKSAKIRTLDFLAYLALFSYLSRMLPVNPRNIKFHNRAIYRQENAKFEFWRIFQPRLWPYHWMKFDEILIRYRVGSLLRACKKPMHLADFRRQITTV